MAKAIPTWSLRGLSAKLARSATPGIGSSTVILRRPFAFPPAFQRQQFGIQSSSIPNTRYYRVHPQYSIIRRATTYPSASTPPIGLLSARRHADHRCYSHKLNTSPDNDAKSKQATKSASNAESGGHKQDGQRSASNESAPPSGEEHESIAASVSKYLHLPKIPHRPSKEELLQAANGFWQRLKIRFKWASIRSMRPWNADEWGAFVSWFMLGHIVWILVGTTTFFSLLILSINTVFAQGMSQANFVPYPLLTSHRNTCKMDW